jgi:hypothetical protein
MCNLTLDQFYTSKIKLYDIEPFLIPGSYVFLKAVKFGDNASVR